VVEPLESPETVSQVSRGEDADAIAGQGRLPPPGPLSRREHIGQQAVVGADAVESKADEPAAELAGRCEAGELKGAFGTGRLAGLLPFGNGLLGDVEAASKGVLRDL
jgi:hypothetical protein